MASFNFCQILTESVVYIAVVIDILDWALEPSLRTL